MTADYAARVRTLAARHNREWQLLVEDMDRERTSEQRCTCQSWLTATRHRGVSYFNPDSDCPIHGTEHRRHAEAEEHA